MTRKIYESAIEIYVSFLVIMFVLIGCRDKKETNKYDSFDYALYPVKGEHYNWGFINSSGEIIIAPKFKYCSYFKDGMSLVRGSTGFGYIDKTGVITIDTIYSRATIFSEGLAAVTIPDSSIKFIDKENVGQFSAPFALKVNVFQDGLARFQGFNRKYGFIDNEGKIVIQAKYDFISLFHEGLARFWLDDGTDYGLYGFIDKNGLVVIDPMPLILYDFANGLALAYDGKKFGYIDKKGELKIQLQFDSARTFSDDHLARIHQDGKWGYINLNGEVVINPIYEDAFGFNSGLAITSLNGKDYGVIDYNGKWVSLPSYKRISQFRGELASIKTDEGVSFINRKGDLINTKYDFKNSMDFISDDYLLSDPPELFEVATDRIDFNEIINAIFHINEDGIFFKGYNSKTTYAEVKNSIKKENSNLGGSFGGNKINKGYAKALKYGNFGWSTSYVFWSLPGKENSVTTINRITSSISTSFTEEVNSQLKSVTIEIYNQDYIQNKREKLTYNLEVWASKYLGKEVKELDMYDAYRFPFLIQSEGVKIIENDDYAILIENFFSIRIHVIYK
jgi:hypothetical protein